MKHLETTMEEAREPLKMLQGSLIANTFDDFVFKPSISTNGGLISKALKNMLDVLFWSEIELNKQLEPGVVLQHVNNRQLKGSSTSLPGPINFALGKPSEKSC